MKRKKYDLRSTLRAQLGRGPQSIEDRHANVDHHHIGIEAPNLLNRIAAVSYCSYDLKFLTQYCSHPRQDPFMIVGE